MSTSYGPESAVAFARERAFLEELAREPGQKGVCGRLRLAMGNDLRHALVVEIMNGSKPHHILPALAEALAASLTTLSVNLGPGTSGLPAADIIGIVLGHLVPSYIKDFEAAQLDPDMATCVAVVRSDQGPTEAPKGRPS